MTDQPDRERVQQARKKLNNKLNRRPDQVAHSPIDVDKVSAAVEQLEQATSALRMAMV